MTEITIQEVTFVDKPTNSDKFYRAFVFDSFWVTQYGKNGTVGTFTKILVASSPEAAQKAAAAKIAEKIKTKGYRPERSGSVLLNAVIDTDTLHLLDTAAMSLPSLGAGASFGGPSQPIALVEITGAQPDDRTDHVIIALGDRSIVSRSTRREDMSPPLGVRPMLASVQTEDTIQSAMRDSDWIAQFKYDGDRVVVEVINGDIRVLNRQGNAKVKNVGTAQLEPFRALHTGRWVFDGEVVGRTLVLFDLITATDGIRAWVDEQTPFTQRYNALAAICDALRIETVGEAADDHAVVLAPIAEGAVEKALFLAAAHSEQREGIILRHSDGAYEGGRRSSRLIKHKFVKDADVIVTELHPSKDSVTLSVHRDNGELLVVGNASTIGKGVVAVGDVWLVHFLYVTDVEHPRLVQPRLVSKRDDKGAFECSIQQFANAGTAKVV